jgi:hypothetical protein
VSKDYDFETATEGERWAHDQGYEAGWNNRLVAEEMDIGDVREVMEIVLAALTRLANEQAERKATRGRIEFDDAVIPLTEEGDQWGRHDDPEQS